MNTKGPKPKLTSALEKRVLLYLKTHSREEAAAHFEVSVSSIGKIVRENNPIKNPVGRPAKVTPEFVTSVCAFLKSNTPLEAAIRFRVSLATIHKATREGILTGEFIREEKPPKPEKIVREKKEPRLRGRKPRLGPDRYPIIKEMLKEGYNFTQIGKKLSLSRERIRQLTSIGIHKEGISREVLLSERKCRGCEEVFQPKRPSQTRCLRTCYKKNTPEQKQKNKEKMSLETKARWQDPVYRESIMSKLPETKKLISEKAKARWANPEWASTTGKKVGNTIKAHWENPEWKSDFLVRRNRALGFASPEQIKQRNKDIYDMYDNGSTLEEIIKAFPSMKSTYIYNILCRLRAQRRKEAEEQSKLS